MKFTNMRLETHHLFQSIVAGLLSFFLLFALSGCGKKSPLSLPQTETAPTKTSTLSNRS
jgi:predicted small lipoprotein YifL